MNAQAAKSALLNDSYPGAARGQTVEVETRGGQLFARIGRKSVKVSARWLDWPADQDRPRLRPRALKVKESVL